MEHEYIVILRASSTDVTALAELELDSPAGCTRTTRRKHLIDCDQLIIRFTSGHNLGLRLAELLNRKKVIWFEVIR
jgi:hypothetical protein